MGRHSIRGVLTGRELDVRGTDCKRSKSHRAMSTDVSKTFSLPPTFEDYSEAPFNYGFRVPSVFRIPTVTLRMRNLLQNSEDTTIMTLAGKLAGVIRQRYEQCSPDRYPTEDSLAEFILEHAEDAGIDLRDLPDELMITFDICAKCRRPRDNHASHRLLCPICIYELSHTEIEEGPYMQWHGAVK